MRLQMMLHIFYKLCTAIFAHFVVSNIHVTYTKRSLQYSVSAFYSISSRNIAVVHLWTKITGGKLIGISTKKVKKTVVKNFSYSCVYM